MTHLHPTQLLEFHFGSLVATDRDAVEAHVLMCADCMRDFVLMKRDVELGATDNQRPAPAVRARILASPMPQMWVTYRRRVTLIAIAAAALLALYRGHSHRVSPQREFPPVTTASEGHSEAQLIDAANQIPETINLL